MTSNFIIAIMAMIIAVMFLNPLNKLSSESDVVADASDRIVDKSIAVLPFKDDSEESDNQYFCDGIMDEILSHLQKIADLGVKSRTAVEPYRNSTKSFAMIAEELGVAFILEGAVRKYGDRFRVTTQLIDVESGNHLWAETYDGVFSDTIFVVQSGIAKKVATSLDAVITPEEEFRIDKMPTNNVVAYDFYIRAQHERTEYWRTLDKKHLENAHILFDKTLRIDPTYLMAIIGKGATFMAGQNYDSALVYAKRALVIEPDAPNPYGLLGECYFFMGQSNLAIENYSRAIDLSPNNEGLWHQVALGRVYSIRKNDVPKALPYFSRVLKKTNNDELLPSLYQTIGASYLKIGAYEKAEYYLFNSAVLGGGCINLYSYCGLLLAQGRIQEMQHYADSVCRVVGCEWTCNRILFETAMLLEEFEKAQDSFYKWENVTGRLGNEIVRDYQIAYVYDQLGKKKEAEFIFNVQIKKLKSLLDQKRDADEFIPRSTLLFLARIYAYQSKRNEAIKYLSEYAKGGFTNGWHDFILIDPYFEKLREDPEFKAIVKHAQDEKAAIRAQVREMEERGEIDL
jgi:TolB-like protein/tetratricopeptide (TPR) repeat protein